MCSMSSYLCALCVKKIVRIMNNEFKNFGLYGRESWTISPEFFHLVSIDSSCRKHDWVIKPHFHSKLYQFFLIKSGSGTFIFNEKTKPFSGKQLIIMPDNNLHGFQFSEDILGYTLSVASNVIEKVTASDKQLAHELNQVRILNLENHIDDFNDLFTLIQAIDREFLQQDEKIRLTLETLLLLFTIKIFRLNFKFGREKTYIGANKELTYYKSFLKKIKTSIPTNKSIDEFTKDLGISKTHLNRICQSIVGKSTKQVISSYLMNEAMILLTHTNLTISEIAHQLEFKDVSYFCRFFKKQANTSPAKFKEDNLAVDKSVHSVALNY
jgi:AraC family transcriptional regulator, transcriptional activator of pobA